MGIHTSERHGVTQAEPARKLTASLLPEHKRRKTKKMTLRLSTIKALELVRKAAEDNFGRYVSDTDIWRAVHVKDVLPRTAQFLWKGLHNAHRVGNYWVHIPECEDHTICKECDETEDLTHILVGCNSPGQEIIWKAAETLWLEKEDRWPAVSLGTILSCGLAEFRDEKGKLKHGTQRLYRILMSESAYLIWRLRNDRVISRDGEPATEDKVTNKWKYAINLRLQVDKTLANRPTKGNKPALGPQLVLATWSNTLDNEQSLPADWLREPRVLVGSCAFPKTPTRRRNSHGIG
jgi:ribonuclease HI